jgi:hypothetical protein
MFSATGRGRWIVPLVLALAIVVVNLHGAMGCSDSRWSIHTAVSLLDHGDFDLDEFRPIVVARQFSFTEQVNGHIYTMYPFGTSILAAPLVVLLRPAAAAAFAINPSLRASMESAARARGCPPTEGEPVVSLHSWTEQIIASAIVALTAVLLYAIARDEVSVPGAVLVALLFAFATSAWSTASRSLWQHGPSMLLLAAALFLQRRRRFPSLTGGLLAFAYLVRPTNALPLACAAAWTAATHPRRIIAFGIGAAVVIAPWLALNHHIYADWLPPYYHPAYFAGNPFFWDAFAGLVIGPARGLLVYSPVLVFSIAGVAMKVRRRTFTMLDMSLAACVVVYWVAIARVNRVWWGGDSYGPRFFTDMLPYLIFWMIPVVAWLESPLAPHANRLVAGGVFAVAAAVSVLMQAQGVFNPAAMRWNHEPPSVELEAERLWDWRYPPFLAGVVAAPREETQPPPLACSAAPAAPHGVGVLANSRYGVTLAWTAASGVVADYLIAVGSTPGAHDLPARRSRSTTLRVSRVPPGTYYVRVHGTNACGVGPPSEEVAVSVR